MIIDDIYYGIFFTALVNLQVTMMVVEARSLEGSYRLSKFSLDEGTLQLEDGLNISPEASELKYKQPELLQVRIQ